LKIALFPQLSAKLWNLEQIWWTDADFHSQRGYLAKSRNFANSRWRTDAILKIVFWLYLGAILADVTNGQMQHIVTTKLA